MNWSSFVVKLNVLYTNVVNLIPYLIYSFYHISPGRSKQIPCEQGAIEGGLTVREAVMVLSLSERQTYTLKKKVWDKGHVSILHGNQGKSPSTAP